MNNPQKLRNQKGAHLKDVIVEAAAWFYALLATMSYVAVGQPLPASSLPTSKMTGLGIMNYLKGKLQFARYRSPGQSRIHIYNIASMP
jgi:hypothetical protein